MTSEHVHILLAVLAGILIDRYLLNWFLGLVAKLLGRGSSKAA